MTNKRLDDVLDILGIDLITDHRMTTDEIISCLASSVDEEGEIIDSEGFYTGLYFADLIKILGVEKNG